MKKYKLEVTVSFKNGMTTALTVQVFVELWEFVTETGGLGFWRTCAMPYHCYNIHCNFLEVWKTSADEFFQNIQRMRYPDEDCAQKCSTVVFAAV